VQVWYIKIYQQVVRKVLWPILVTTSLALLGNKYEYEYKSSPAMYKSSESVLKVYSSTSTST